MVVPIGALRLFMFRRKDGHVEQCWLTYTPRDFQDRRLGDYHANYVSCAEWDKWERLGQVASATQNRQLKAADLEGRNVGDAFVEYVIRDPKVRANVEWLASEFCNFARLLSNGEFPSPLTHSKFGPPLIFEGTKWPVILDQERLHEEIDRMAVGGDWWNHQLTQRADDSLFRSAQAIASRHKAFFDLLRGSDLIAEGTFEATGTLQTIQTDTWSRPHYYVDVKLGDLHSIEAGSSRRISTHVKLYLQPYPWLKSALSAGREHLPWGQVCQRIPSEWLIRNGFGPPEVETRVVCGKYAESPHWDQPTKPVAPILAPTPQVIARPARQRGTPGRREAYDWPALKEPLSEHVNKHGEFASLTELTNWCVENVKLRRGARHPKGQAIDQKNAQKAIRRHALDKIGLGANGASD